MNNEQVLHNNISFDEYLMLDGISSTDIRNMLRTPAYYQYQKQHPKKSSAMDFGSAVHTAILEPELFRQDYVMMPDVDGRSKEAKGFREANQGKHILTAYDYSAIQELTFAIKNNPAAHMLLYNTGYKKRWVESSILWTDESGLKCKCRPDLLIDNTDNIMIVDLKTTMDASPEGFQKSIIKYGYYIQSAYYMQGVKKTIKNRKNYSFYIIALEKSAPYQIAVYKIDESFLDIGETQISKAFGLFEKCFESGEYAGYSKNPVLMQAPDWLIEKYIF